MKRTVLLVISILGLLSFKEIKLTAIPPKKQMAVTAIPLYRLVDPYGYHFYTTNEAEKNATIKDLGYRDEGILGYVFPQKVPGSVPLYRYRSELNYITNIQQNKTVWIARHFYTTNQNDEELKFTGTGISVRHGNSDAHCSVRRYTSEGIQCYVANANSDGTNPIYWLFKTDIRPVDEGDHGKLTPGSYDNFYTNNEEEKYSAKFKYGYSEKGIAWYTWKSAISK